MPPHRIQLFASDIHPSGPDTPPLVELPASPLGRQILVVLLLDLALLILSLLHPAFSALVTPTALALPFLPLIMLIYYSMRWRDHYEAWFEAEGLRIHFDCTRWPEYSMTRLIAWQEIARISMFRVHRQTAASYWITFQPSGHTLSIHTDRPVELATRDLQRLAQFPAAKHVEACSL